VVLVVPGRAEPGLPGHVHRIFIVKRYLCLACEALNCGCAYSSGRPSIMLTIHVNRPEFRIQKASMAKVIAIQIAGSISCARCHSNDL
jgi:hypothetical protein